MKKLSVATGVRLGSANVAWLLAEYLFGLHDKHHDLFFLITPFSMLLPITFTTVAYIKLKKRLLLDGGYAARLLPGAIITFIATTISVVGQYCYHIFINQDYFTRMIEISKAKGVPNPEAYFNLSSYLLQVLFMHLIIGSVATLILALFMKNRK